MDWGHVGDFFRGQGSNLLQGGNVGSDIFRRFVPGQDGHAQIATYITSIQGAAIAHNAETVRMEAQALAQATQTTAPSIAVLAAEIEAAASSATPDFVAIANITGLIAAQNNPEVMNSSMRSGFDAVRDHWQGLSPQQREAWNQGRFGRR